MNSTMRSLYQSWPEMDTKESSSRKQGGRPCITSPNGNDLTDVPFFGSKFQKREHHYIAVLLIFTVLQVCSILSVMSNFVDVLSKLSPDLFIFRAIFVQFSPCLFC